MAAQAYYTIVQKLEELLLADPNVNTVTHGNFDEVDLAKQTIYPLSHFNIVSGNSFGGVWTFSIQLACLDLLDISKTPNDNLDDILNTQMTVITRLLQEVSRGATRDFFTLSGEPSIEVIINAYEMGLSGWMCNFNIEYPNLDIGIC
jgi:hypothetical protein